MHQDDRLARAFVEISDLDVAVMEARHKLAARPLGASQCRKRIISERTPTAKIARHST